MLCRISYALYRIIRLCMRFLRAVLEMLHLQAMKL